MTHQHRSRTPWTPHRSLCPVSVWYWSPVHYYTCEKDDLPQPSGPTIFSSNLAQLYNREFLARFRLGVFIFSNAKQKRFSTFKITYMNIQCNLIITSGFKSKHKGTKNWDCNNTSINMRAVLFFKLWEILALREDTHWFHHLGIPYYY